MKIYDKCPGCDESVLGRKPVTMFECRSWIGLDGVLTESNTCLRRQLARLQGIVGRLCCVWEGYEKHGSRMDLHYSLEKIAREAAEAAKKENEHENI